MVTEDICLAFRGRSVLGRCVVGLALLLLSASELSGQETPRVPDNSPAAVTGSDGPESTFLTVAQPLLQQHCVRCHNADVMKSGIRVDQLDGTLQDRHLFLWKDILKQLEAGAMPPDDEPQLTPDEKTKLTDWIRDALTTARARDTARNGMTRRLTVPQYRNTLRDLLGLQENLSVILPPDGVSRDGFANNGQVMVLSPLQMEYYFDIAEKSLELCLVDEQSRPVIQNFRMDLGTDINRDPCRDELILGADSWLLRNQDFVITELSPKRTFDYQPFVMRRVWDYIEGYVGNDTIRGMRHFDSIYHSVFACMRGTRGYPRGEPFEVVSDGLLLRPAIPSSELFGQSSTYGPKANFKISLRELPDHGDFRVTVRASRYPDALLLPADVTVLNATSTDSGSSDSANISGSVSGERVIVELTTPSAATATLSQPGIYEVAVDYELAAGEENLRLRLGDCQAATSLKAKPADAANSPPEATPGAEPPKPVLQAALLLVRLKDGPLPIQAVHGEKTKLHRLVLTRVPDSSAAAQKFTAFEQRSPQLSVLLGLRRDCGSTLNPVGEPRPVNQEEVQTFVFSGAINDFPAPSVEKDNVNYLAGIREIGVRSEYTDGRDMPRLRIHSVEFEGPIYDTWPPDTHRRIFIESTDRDNLPVYARQIIQNFMSRAWRRPVTDSEVGMVTDVWAASYAELRDFRRSIQDALVVVLTSPQFLFLTEHSATPEAEPLDDWELASKLSYFLWNSPPDPSLRDAAAAGQLRSTLSTQTERMLADPRFGLFLQEFTSQWLSLDKLDVVEVDQKKYPMLTRDTRAQLRKEPVEFLRHLIAHNLPLRTMLQSDFAMVNDTVASYYGLAGRSESGLVFTAVRHDQPHLGGLLSQAGILAGLSDGRESNPIKRGAWLARKMIAEPPDDPPPNVPQLTADDKSLTLRQRLELHRNQEGCVKCHSNIDPWGVPFETFDAGGRLKQSAVEAQSTLPDGTSVADLNDLKRYLANDRLDQVAFSVLKHLSCYAVGRSLTYNETEALREQALQLKSTEYRLRDMVQFVISSELFQTK
jgi:hypothetical protein